MYFWGICLCVHTFNVEFDCTGTSEQNCDKSFMLVISLSGKFSSCFSTVTPVFYESQIRLNSFPKNNYLHNIEIDTREQAFVTLNLRCNWLQQKIHLCSKWMPGLMRTQNSRERIRNICVILWNILWGIRKIYLV